MKPSDCFGIALFAGFGLWWAIFPGNVIRFYNWFHRGQIKPLPARAANVVRVVGIAWIVLIFIVEFSTFARH